MNKFAITFRRTYFLKLYPVV